MSSFIYTYIYTALSNQCEALHCRNFSLDRRTCQLIRKNFSSNSDRPCWLKISEVATLCTVAYLDNLRKLYAIDLDYLIAIAIKSEIGSHLVEQVFQPLQDVCSQQYARICLSVLFMLTFRRIPLAITNYSKIIFRFQTTQYILQLLGN